MLKVANCGGHVRTSGQLRLKRGIFHIKSLFNELCSFQSATAAKNVFLKSDRATPKLPQTDPGTILKVI